MLPGPLFVSVETTDVVDSYYSPRMPFGKHRGKLLSDIPTGYLVWLHNWAEIDDRLADAVDQELGRRNEVDQSTPPLGLPDLRPLADDWYRQLAREFHPDLGGSNECMRAVNRGRELLIEMLGAAQ